MGNPNSKRMTFFMTLNAVIIIIFIYVSFSTKDILPLKHLHSAGTLPMRRRIEHRSSSVHYGSTIKRNVLKRKERNSSETSKQLEVKGASLLHSNIEAAPFFLAYSTQQPKSSESLMKSQQNTMPIVSSINGSSSVPNTSSEIPALPLLTPVLTRTVYEPGHLNEELDIKRICIDRGLFLRLLILITSAQSHFMARMSIRQTWMHYASRRDVGMAFVLGRTTNATLNESLNKENYMYGDMIRGNFIDSYFNLTLKTISMLEWADMHCPRVKYILKTDDDMFINVPRLLDFIDGHKDTRTIYGRLARRWKPVRSSKSKYFVSYKLYSGLQYPTFTTGPAYLLTGDIVHELYTQSLNTYYMQLEDVFITGIVSKSLEIMRLHAKEFRNSRTSFLPCNIRKAISVHMIKPSEQYNLWKSLLDSSIKCK
ncbi:beta-1,3-galactosyltransferase 5-like [Drosophila subobscura]|uniref:beta-1,3-galactosyltransferase 5-like n=1 Tax=Drosophila subobscura TaxID=7241 RepID=UPI00155A5D75|nr:beta-1,3-galactosyltransferase 5-like [Drosophila subobscura]